MHVDQIYIQYLKENNQKGINLIYKKYALHIVSLIKNNSGTEDDGYDIFQESLVDIYHMALEKDFQLTTNFKSFLMLVCKRKWLNALKKRKIEVTKSTEDLFHIEDMSLSTYEQDIIQVEKENLVMKILDTLGKSCQDIIRRCITEKHQEKIAESLGISYAYLRKKKSECMAELIKRVNSNDEFKSLY